MSLPSLWGKEGADSALNYSAENSRRSKHQLHWLRQDPENQRAMWASCGHWHELKLTGDMLRLWTLADRTAGTVNKTRVWLHQGLRHLSPHRMYMSIQHIKKTVAGQLEIILRGSPSWSLRVPFIFILFEFIQELIFPSVLIENS